MAEERRSARRANMSGVRATYESAAGDHVETDALNLGTGGLFLLTSTPLAVGKRIALEVHVSGEPAPWSALGRVVWARAQPDAQQRPAGMGVKLIDVDDAVITAIERLVEAQDHTAPGVGQSTAAPIVGVAPIVAAPPSRERTLLGVGLATSAPSSPPRATPPVASPVPVSPAKPAATVPLPMIPVTAEEMPVDSPPRREQAREPSVVIDLVSGSDDDDETLPPTPYKPAPVSAAVPDPRPRSTGRWIAVLILLVVAGAAAYVILDGDVDRILKPADNVETPPRPTPPAPPPSPAAPARSAVPYVAPTTTPATITTTVPSASAAPSTVPSLRPPAGARAAPGAAPGAPMTRSAGATASPAKRGGSEDNPY